MKKKLKRQPKAKPKTKSKPKRKAVKHTTSAAAVKRTVVQPAAIVPGEIILGAGDIVAFHGRRTLDLTVANTGDRPIQVGSHCHFFEANRALRFDREQAYGFRLQVPAGTAVRFEPGEEKRVTLVALGGNRVSYGINGLTQGRLDDPSVKARALAAARDQGFMSTKE
jgi:urease beta subunit